MPCPYLWERPPVDMENLSGMLIGVTSPARAHKKSGAGSEGNGGEGRADERDGEVKR